jgi:hypothetical protein
MFDVGVDDGNQIGAFGHSHGPAWEKVVLWVYKEESGMPVRLWN